MKAKKLILVSLLSAGLVLFANFADAQRIFVNIEPAIPVYVHPACPSPRHVWVESEWVVSGGVYVHHPGYWAIPPEHFHVWIPGHWEREYRGSYWVPGHWRR